MLGLALTATCFTFGQDRANSGEVNHWNESTYEVTRSDDTLSPPSFSDACIANGFTLVGSAGSGYISGTNDYGDIGKGQRFPFDGSAEIEGFLVWYGAIQNEDNMTQYVGSVTDKDGTTVLANTSPHTISAIDTTSAGAAGWHPYTFSSAVTVTDTFYTWVAWQLGTDTMGIVHTVDPCGSNAYEIWGDGSIYAMNDASSWGSNIDLSIIVLVNNISFTGIFDQDAVEYGMFTDGTNLFVNAVSDDVTMETITIHDMSGRVIKEFTVNFQTSNYTFDVSDIPTGNYLVSINSSRGGYAQKIHIQ